MKQNEGQSEKEFQDHLHAVYIEKRDGNDAEFDEAIKWYMKTVASQMSEKHLEGLSEREIQKLAALFIN